ncbi:MAG TPA: lytic transglycosylase domain-containing protein [Chloroflexota bacterium]|nr:lytic transglycosylase domain-containing protein [Chloroflexota bacterium]
MRPGLHWPNVARADLSARKRFTMGRFRGAVVLSVCDPEDARWVAANAAGPVVYRVYEPMGNLAAPAEVAERAATWLGQVDPEGLAQLLNEPDLEYRGMTPEEFGRWWTACARELLSRLPRLRLGFPAPSVAQSGEYLSRVWQSGELSRASFIAERGYWQRPEDAYSERWGMRWKRSLGPRLPIYVCEFGNTDPAVSKATKAKQYLDYATSLPRCVALAAAFIGAGGDPAWDSEPAGRLWIDDAMALAIGQGEGLPFGGLNRGYHTMSIDQVMRYKGPIIAAATARGLKPSIVAGLIDVESGGNPDATSPDNGPGLGHALGLMQVLEGEFTPTQNGHDVETNLAVGCRVLRAKIDAFGGRLESGLAAYFGAVDQDGNPTDATDLTGTSGKKYVALVLASAERFGELDAEDGGKDGSPCDPDFQQYAPRTGTWREAATNLKGIADDALAAGRKGRQLAEQIASGWGTR